jgi:carboxypeptidase family protein
VNATAPLRGSISLAAVRTIVVLLAASLSIAGYAYQYFEIATAPTDGELLTVVRNSAGAPVSDARIAVLTLSDAPVASFRAAAPAGGLRVLKEGTYRLRVSHPKYTTETRMVQVIAGHTSEVRVKLAPRVVVTPPRSSTSAPAPAHVNPATRAVSDGVDSLKRMFKK